MATGVIEQVPSRNLSLIGTDQERLRALFDGLAAGRHNRPAALAT